MVAMIVSYADAMNILHTEVNAFQTLDYRFGVYSGINENATASVTYKCTVSTASATETFEKNGIMPAQINSYRLNHIIGAGVCGILLRRALFLHLNHKIIKGGMHRKLRLGFR